MLPLHVIRSPHPLPLALMAARAAFDVTAVRIDRDLETAIAHFVFH